LEEADVAPYPVRPALPSAPEEAPAPKQSFWTTLPGILTGIAAVLVAVGGLVAALLPLVRGGDPGAPPTSAPPVTMPTVPPPSSPPSTGESTTTPPDPRPTGLNLVTNGDAEDGCLARANGDPVPGWTRVPRSATFTTERYGYNGFPPQSIPSTGRCLFAGGPAVPSDLHANDTSEATQLIDLGGTGESQSTLTYTLSALLGGYSTFPTDGRNSQDDQARLSIEFLASDSSVLGSAQIGPVTDADRNHSTTLLPRSTSGALPPKTRKIMVTVVMTKENIGPDKTIYNGYNDGYADNISLVLSRQ